MDSNERKKTSTRKWLLAGAVAALLLTSTAAVAWFGPLSNSRNGNAPLTFEVQQGPLTISITESGTVRAREQIVITSEVEGVNTIIGLVEEGTVVSKGDLLVELDRSRLEDQKVEQEIRLLNAEAALIRAQEQLAVTQSQSESDVSKANLVHAFAKEDLRKYLEGDYKQRLAQLDQRITLTREEVTRAQDRLEGSRRLLAERYISQSELNSDNLAVIRAELDRDMAMEEKRLFETFTHPRQVRQLESDLEQAEMELERVRRRARANVVQAEADLRARQSEYTQQANRLTRLQEQLEKCTIYAPSSGMVVYATSVQSNRRGNVEPLEAGQQVREREELIYLPTTGGMMVELKVHESSLEKVRVGQRVRVQVDAVPGRVYWGRVTRIAPLPDATSVWLNPDLTVYSTDVVLDGSDDEIRTGMTCRAEIIVAQYPDAVYVPVQSVVRVNGEPTVYLLEGQHSRPHPVRIGMDNNQMVHILEGLRPGQRVMLAPPLTSDRIQQLFDEDETAAISTDSSQQSANAPRGEARSAAEAPAREGQQERPQLRRPRNAERERAE